MIPDVRNAMVSKMNMNPDAVIFNIFINNLYKVVYVVHKFSKAQTWKVWRICWMFNDTVKIQNSYLAGITGIIQ